MKNMMIVVNIIQSFHGDDDNMDNDDKNRPCSFGIDAIPKTESECYIFKKITPIHFKMNFVLECLVALMKHEA